MLLNCTLSNWVTIQKNAVLSATPKPHFKNLNAKQPIKMSVRRVTFDWHHLPSLRSYFSPNLTLFVGFIQGGTWKLFIVPSFHPTFFSISLFSPPKVQPSAGTCQKPTPWSAWPTTTMKRTPSLAKWPRRRLSSAGGWRTSWKVPALSASPQPTPVAHSHGTNPAPPSPVPAPTIMRAPSTEGD